MEHIKNLVLMIARALVDDPDQVKVNVVEGGSTLIFELSVAKNDVGKVIGKQGRIADAFRVILSAVGPRLKKRCVLEIVE